MSPKTCSSRWQTLKQRDVCKNSKTSSKSVFCATVEKNGKRHIYCRVFILEISSISYSPRFSVSLLIPAVCPKAVGIR